MKTPSGFTLGGRGSGPINVALQRPTVNIKEAENVGEQAAAAAHNEPTLSFTKHATFGPKVVTHPGLED
jgi:hypothetical protein